MANQSRRTLAVVFGLTLATGRATDAHEQPRNRFFDAQPPEKPHFDDPALSLVAPLDALARHANEERRADEVERHQAGDVRLSGTIAKHQSGPTFLHR